MFVSHKKFYEREFNILPSINSNSIQLSNSSPTQSNQDTIEKEIEGNQEAKNNDLNMSCDEIRPHTSYKKLFEYHRSRFPNVRVLQNHKEPGA